MNRNKGFRSRYRFGELANSKFDYCFWCFQEYEVQRNNLQLRVGHYKRIPICNGCLIENYDLFEIKTNGRMKLIGYFIYDDSLSPASNYCDESDVEREIFNLFESLPLRNKIAVMGIMERKTLDEVGKKIGVTRERVRQIFTRTICGMQKKLNLPQIRPYISNL